MSVRCWVSGVALQAFVRPGLRTDPDQIQLADAARRIRACWPSGCLACLACRLLRRLRLADVGVLLGAGFCFRLVLPFDHPLQTDPALMGDNRGAARRVPRAEERMRRTEDRSREADKGDGDNPPFRSARGSSRMRRAEERTRKSRRSRDPAAVSCRNDRRPRPLRLRLRPQLAAAPQQELRRPAPPEVRPARRSGRMPR